MRGNNWIVGLLVVDWIQGLGHGLTPDAGTAGNNWSNTLVIVTADHDHLLLGPDSDTVPFQDLVDKGVKKVPGYRWQASGHSNLLVPLFARGPRAEMFASCATRRDSYTDAKGRTFGRGLYIDQPAWGLNVFEVETAGAQAPAAGATAG